MSSRTQRTQKRFRNFALLLALIVFTASALPAAAAPFPPRAYLPLVSGAAGSQCGLNAQEAAIANSMRTNPEQRRPSLTCNPILARVARERALDMGVRRYFSHTNPDGFAANYLVRRAGYSLPNWYSQANDGNNLESIAAGYGTAAEAWAGWMDSTGHRTHLLGLEPFWAEQIDYGIGYANVSGSPYGHYWVVITARH